MLLIITPAYVPGILLAVRAGVLVLVARHILRAFRYRKVDGVDHKRNPNLDTSHQSDVFAERTQIYCLYIDCEAAHVVWIEYEYIRPKEDRQRLCSELVAGME